MDIKGKIAIITGANRGIGKAIAERFLREGAKVAITDLDSECLSLAEEWKNNGYEAIAVQGDVSKREDVDNLFRQVILKFGRVDILVNNAGIVKDARFHKITEEQWDSVIAVNLKSMFHTCQNAVKEMMTTGGGAIVNITSISAQIGNFGQANYVASKAGVIGLTRTLSNEYAPKGIRVNAIAPGFIITDMLNTIPKERLAEIAGQIPIRRGGDPSEIASAVLFLASEAASFITGQVLSVNGGQYLS